MQATVRLHTKQVIYTTDPHGNLKSGASRIPRSIIEYIVLEKHYVDPHSEWRIVGKIESEGNDPYPQWWRLRNLLRLRKRLWLYHVMKHERVVAKKQIEPKWKTNNKLLSS